MVTLRWHWNWTACVCVCVVTVGTKQCRHNGNGCSCTICGIMKRSHVILCNTSTGRKIQSMCLCDTERASECTKWCYCSLSDVKCNTHCAITHEGCFRDEKAFLRSSWVFTYYTKSTVHLLRTTKNIIQKHKCVHLLDVLFLRHDNVNLIYTCNCRGMCLILLAHSGITIFSSGPPTPHVCSVFALGCRTRFLEFSDSCLRRSEARSIVYNYQNITWQLTSSRTFTMHFGWSTSSDTQSESLHSWSGVLPRLFFMLTSISKVCEAHIYANTSTVMNYHCFLIYFLWQRMSKQATVHDGHSEGGKHKQLGHYDENKSRWVHKRGEGGGSVMKPFWEHGLFNN